MNFTANIPAFWRVLLLIATLALSVLLSGCEEEEDELSGPFGPGVGGTAAPAAGTGITEPLNDSGGSVFGGFEYDGGYWMDYSILLGAVDPVLFIFGDTAGTDDLTLILTRISGRPDTPCRFEAAILARDQNYTILASGDRTNDQGLEFHQVNLSKGSEYLNLYCATVSGNLGVKITGISLSGNKLRYEQVHFILNSVSP